MRAFLALALLATSGCGNFLSVQVEIERLCLTRGDALAIPALPLGGALSLTGAISAPLSAATDVELRFDSLELRNLRGATDFSFLEDAAVFAPSDQAVPLSTFEHSPAGEPPAARLVATLEAQRAPADERLDYLLSVSVSALAAPVVADLEVCAQVVGHFSP